MTLVPCKDGRSYKLWGGTFYHAETEDKVVEVLEACRLNHTRIVVDYGDPDTGVSWGEVNDVQGYVGRSSGWIKVPILTFNTRSLGGPAMLEHCILSIKTTRGKRVLYQFEKKVSNANQR